MTRRVHHLEGGDPSWQDDIPAPSILGIPIEIDPDMPEGQFTVRTTGGEAVSVFRTMADAAQAAGFGPVPEQVTVTYTARIADPLQLDLACTVLRLEQIAQIDDELDPNEALRDLLICRLAGDAIRLRHHLTPTTLAAMAQIDQEISR